MPGGVTKTYPRQVWYVGSKADAVRGARLLCLSIPKELKVRQTFMAGSQGAQANGQATQLSEQVWKDGQLLLWRGPHGQVHYPQQALDWKGFHGLQGQVELLVWKPNPSDIIADALGRCEHCGYMRDIKTHGGDGRTDSTDCKKTYVGLGLPGVVGSCAQVEKLGCQGCSGF